ncbi:MarR family transcriptional regulator [Lutibacter sp. A64]|uniref:MarR family winged helix-turn-helix transcriptional regulator n=1 Tax=Lutibacter sp. A64 TaxID=2918526 RepID=UPI001F05A18C|nr:MarR family transcriptional regulator [Lutibacter sp. A64]UMB54237.1 MarR family transcriptional regulator [Lutibacter sp. A64]
MKYIEILVKLRRIIRSINLESKKIEKEFGISIPQLLVLKYLSDQKDYRAFAKDIKAYINLNASTVSGIISRLEGKGLLAKTMSSSDKRAIYIVLTAKGADLLNNSPSTLQEKLSKRLLKLSTAQIEELDRNIELLTTIMDVEDLDAAPLLTIKEITSQSD